MQWGPAVQMQLKSSEILIISNTVQVEVHCKSMKAGITGMCKSKVKRKGKKGHKNLNKDGKKMILMQFVLTIDDDIGRC